MKSNLFISTLVTGLAILSASMSLAASDMDNRIAASVMETYVFKEGE